MKATKNKLFRWFLILIIGVLGYSCDVSQGWLVDSSLDRMFSPVTFQTSNIGDTVVEVSFTRVIGARKYILELSENDSTMLFDNIKQRIEVTVDTFKAYAINSMATKTEYRKKFTGLYGETNYSVRLWVVNEDSTLTSGYSMISFKTMAEQLFKENLTGKGLDSVSLKWSFSEKITHIVMHPVETADNSLDITKTLSSADIASGTTSFSNLRSGTDYQFTLFYNTIKRGKLVVRTLGLPNSVTYTVSPSDNFASVAQAISGFIAENNLNINVFFDAGNTYTLTGLTIPDGVDKIKFTGQADANGVLPSVILNSLIPGSVTASVSEVSFENLNINGNAAYFCVTVANSIPTLKTISFNNCELSNFGRGVVSVSNVTLAIENIAITHSVISKIGNYGIINVSGSNALVNNITCQYCTLYDITTHFADFRTGANFNMINCTIYNSFNAGYTLNRFIRSNDAAPFPVSINIQKCVFGGTNNGTNNLIGLTYKTATNTAVLPITSFSGSYSASDFPLQYASTVTTSYPGLQIMSVRSADLFVDPANHDFRIKPELIFEGRNKSGDSRWFTE